MGPCNWVVDQCEECCGETFTTLGPERTALLEAWAVDYLWRATGKRYGLCETTYRPCMRSCADTLGYGFEPFIPYKYGSTWTNLSCNQCAGACGCGGVISEIYIPGTYAVTGIVVDGAVLDPLTDVVVYDNSRIVKTDGTPWPTCQDLASPSDPVSGVAGTWQVTVLTGLPVPAGGAMAAGVLACELAKACVADESCRLPKRVQTITRNGITVGFMDAFDGLADLRTGLWEVDAFIEATRATRWVDPVVSSPDVPDYPTQTWPLPV